MSPQERQARIDKYAAEVSSKQEIADSQKINIEQEDVFEARFLITFGFEAYWAIHPENKTKTISLNEMARLLSAANKIASQEMYKASQVSFIGAASAFSKDPVDAFNQMTNKIRKDSEV